MEPEGEADEIVGATASLLTQPLSAVQVDLLKLVWRPIVHAGMWDLAPDWPVWDHVARELHRQHPALDDAAHVLDSLPRMLKPGPWRQRPYGLVWRSSQAMRPDPGERIGLSIAGLAALAAHQGVPRGVPDQLAVLIAHLANCEDGLTAKPNEVAREDVPLARFTGWFTTPTIAKLFVFPDRAIAMLLQHEYAPTVAFSYDSDTDYKVQLGRHISLRQYRNVTTAHGYLDQVAYDDAARAEPVRYSSPLTLVQTFDYLAYVLAADSEWPKGVRLTAAPDLQSAGALSAPVTDEHDFQTALSGLCTVIDQLGVPPIPAEELAKMANDRDRDDANRTVNRLQRWLTSRLADSGDMPRVAAAIAILRAARAVRVEAQHRSTSTRGNAIRARRCLGLPDIVSDWPAAWHIIQSQLAGALDVIRQEVQVALPPQRPLGAC